MAHANNIFAERLKQLRLARGLSLAKMGSFVSISKQAILKFESGTSYPAFLVLIGLADALEVSLDYLVGRSDDPKQRI